MPRDVGVYLQDILDAIDRIREYTSAMSFDSFEGDQKTIDAVLLNLEIIGEACKRVPDSTRDPGLFTPVPREMERNGSRSPIVDDEPPVRSGPGFPGGAIVVEIKE